MTQKRALVSGRIDKAAGTMELSGPVVTICGETDTEFNGSVLHNMTRELIAHSNYSDRPSAYRLDGTLR